MLTLVNNLCCFCHKMTDETPPSIPNSENSMKNTTKPLFPYETKGKCLQNKHILHKEIESRFLKVYQLELQGLIENGRYVLTPKMTSQ